MANSYRIQFSGDVAEGFNVDSVRAHVGEKFGLSGQQLDRLFDGRAHTIKKGVTPDKADSIADQFRQMGMVVATVREQEEPASEAPSPQAEKGESQAPVGEGGESPARPLEERLAQSIGERIMAGVFLGVLMGGVAALIRGATEGADAGIAAAVGTGLGAFILGFLLGPVLPGVPGGKNDRGE